MEKRTADKTCNGIYHYDGAAAMLDAIRTTKITWKDVNMLIIISATPRICAPYSVPNKSSALLFALVRLLCYTPRTLSVYCDDDVSWN